MVMYQKLPVSISPSQCRTFLAPILWFVRNFCQTEKMAMLTQSGFCIFLTVPVIERRSTDILQKQKRGGVKSTGWNMNSADKWTRKEGKRRKKMRILQCKLTTIEAMLGTASNNKELHSEFIASHAPDAPSREEEIAAVGVDEVIEKGMTVFSRNKDGKPILWDYQIKGFFKDACGVLRKVKGTKSSKIKAYKKEIDGLIFVQERQIPVQTAEELTNCQRPLRAQTAQGERNSLASSEEIAAGAIL